MAQASAIIEAATNVSIRLGMIFDIEPLKAKQFVSQFAEEVRSK